MINITQEMTQQEILNACHKASGIPSMILTFIVCAFFFLISLLWVSNKESNKKTLFLIWIFGILLSAAVIILFTFSPDVIQFLKELIY